MSRSAYMYLFHGPQTALPYTLWGILFTIAEKLREFMFCLYFT